MSDSNKAMRSSKAKLSSRSQPLRQRFIEYAGTLEIDQTKHAFEKAFIRIISPKPKIGEASETRSWIDYPPTEQNQKISLDSNQDMSPSLSVRHDVANGEVNAET